MGTAMLDMQGNIRLFGSDSSSRIPEDYELVFNGETVFKNVKSIYGSEETLLLVRKNGKLEQYGHQSDKTYRPITAD